MFNSVAKDEVDEIMANYTNISLLKEKYFKDINKLRTDKSQSKSSLMNQSSESTCQNSLIINRNWAYTHFKNFWTYMNGQHLSELYQTCWRITEYKDRFYCWSKHWRQWRDLEDIKMWLWWSKVATEESHRLGISVNYGKWGTKKNWWIFK